MNYAASIHDRLMVPGTTGGAFHNGVTTSTPFADFEQSYDAINGAAQSGEGSSYTVNDGDTLQSIAAMMWGDASLWYLLASANGLSAGAQLVGGQSLAVPDRVTNTHNNASTFRVYDPNKALGDNSPTAIKPPKKVGGCGVIGQIIATVIAIVVSKLIPVPIIGPVIGNLASQAFLIAIGQQSKINWKSVAITAISAGLAPPGTGNIAVDALNAAVANAATQGIAVATGLQKKFDWAGVAAAGVMGGVSSAVGKLIDRSIAIGDKLGKPSQWASAPGWARGLATSLPSAISGAVTRTVVTGTNFGDNLIAALPDVIGSTIGNAIGDSIHVGGGGSDSPIGRLFGALDKQLNVIFAPSDPKIAAIAKEKAADLAMANGGSNAATMIALKESAGAFTLAAREALAQVQGGAAPAAASGGLSTPGTGQGNTIYLSAPGSLGLVGMQPIPVDLAALLDTQMSQRAREFGAGMKPVIDSLPPDSQAVPAEVIPNPHPFADPAEMGPNGEIIVTGHRLNRRGPVYAMLDLIAHGEGTGDATARRHGFASGYDVTLGYGHYAHSNIPLSQMTLGQVERLQTQILHNPDNHMNSSAVGRYEIVRKTLRELKLELHLTNDMIFSPALQDRLGVALLNRRHMDLYESGRISATQFQYNLSREWASVANPYTGRAQQRTGTTTAQIQAAIAALPRRQGR